MSKTDNTYIYYFYETCYGIMMGSQPWHYECDIVYNLLEIFFPSTVQFWYVLSETDERTHGAQQRVQ